MDDLVLLFKRLVDTFPDIQLKGATMPYTSVNGNMYSYLSKDGFLALRLPPKTREAFLSKYNTTLVTAYGIIQKEYAVVSPLLLQNTEELKPYFMISIEYASALKAKPTKSSKKKE